MGTSSARRGPTTALWRAAKGAATRYLAPEGGGAVKAREVVARYLVALEETPGQGDSLAAFRFTRKVGQDLGAFWQEVDFSGREQACQDRGLALPAHGNVTLLAQGISGVLVGGAGGLEAAVDRVSLVQVLRQAHESGARVAPANLVRRFLANALTLRLALDLGEPLEAAAGGFRRLRDGLNSIKELIEVSLPMAVGEPEPPGTPGDWLGLMGWTWVTATLTDLIAKFEP